MECRNRARLLDGLHIGNDLVLVAALGIDGEGHKHLLAPRFSKPIHASREKDGKLRLVYAGWDDVRVVQPDGCGQARRGWRDGFSPAGRGRLPSGNARAGWRSSKRRSPPIARR
jgi:hypothetical protein